ncbi:SIS domain-containing protein [Thiohalocapsa marina]|uniref:Glutamine--fructose-6-phosphate aminotransferase [isomerizing] n=1 Tax=Thiohalocapsa marina TaxID=424902 RepID=A0A5M8FCX5_9GAMM|nr:SIS domain-containing protein [Thiohalocapsa marina]KAA6182519.1 SIS domain-containing protein [Thiohalocapsa marina]
MPPNVEKRHSWRLYRDEIERQGAALQARLQPIMEQAEQIARRLPLERLSQLYLTGSGDSYIAAVSCQYAYRALAGLSAWAVEAFEVGPYHAPLLAAQTLLVSTSISGRTKTATASLGEARARGAPTLLITNTPGSPATTLADDVIELQVPSIDTSGFIPSTLSYMAGMVAQLGLALALGERLGRIGPEQAERFRAELALALGSLNALIAAHDGPVRAFAARLAGRTPCLIGGGSLYGTALFGEAKLIESAMIPVSVQQVEEWAHIRRFLTGPQSPSVFLATPGRSRQRMLEIMGEARAQDTEVIAVAEAGDAEVAAIAHEVWPVPALNVEPLQPLTAAIPMQLLAYWCMVERDVRPFYADIRPIHIGLTLPPTSSDGGLR